MKKRIEFFVATLILSVCTFAFAGAQTKVKGRITDDNGEPLLGAVVQTKDNSGSSYAVADQDGRFSITVKDPSKAVLVVSMISMTTKEVKLSGKTEVEVVLMPDVATLDQVVVTGYQTKSKRELASAVAIVRTEDIKVQGVMSIDQMLQGQVAGMSVTQTSGSPGSSAKIRVRGTSSIIGNKSPVWVLDGVILDEPVEVDHSDLSGDDAEYLVGNAIAGVNPNDIESITILKDASATAIYGIQAANGVIVVTTKKGKSGRARVSYSGNTTLQQRDSYGRLNLMDAYDRIILSRDINAAGLHYERTMSSLNIGYEGLLNKFESKGLTRAEFKDALDRMAKMNTDWFSLLYRNAMMQSHAASISGGNDNTTYYSSIGVDLQPGTARSEKSDRYTVLAKLNSWVVPKKLYVGIQLNASMTKNTGYNGVNPKTYAYKTARTIPAYNPDGSLFYYEPYSTLGAGKDALKYNVLDEISHTGMSADALQMTAKLNFQWNIIEHLKYELQASYAKNQNVRNSWMDADSYGVANIRGYSRDYYVGVRTDEWNESPLPQGGVLSYGSNSVGTWNVRNQLSWNQNIQHDHVVSVMGVSEVRSSKTDGFSGTWYGYMPERGKTVSPGMTEAYLSKVSGGSFLPDITDNVRNVVSFRGVASYSYKDRYIFNSSISMDGSNQFGTNPKYRFLPIWSVSGKWALSEEEWLKSFKPLTYLAVRLSYGTQGNVDSSTSPDLVLKIGTIDGDTGLASNSVTYWPNADLRWEKTTSYNFGLDFSFFSNRISGTLDAYHKVGTDMIMNKTISGVNGITNYKINAGDMNNSGVELSLAGHLVQERNFGLNLSFNYGFNVNRLVRADTSLGSISVSQKLSGSALIEGVPIGTFYSYDFSCLDHETGLPIFRDKDGFDTWLSDGVLTPNYTLYESELGLVKSGTINPIGSGGFGFGIRFYNFHLNGSFTYSFGASGRLPAIYNGSYSKVFDPEYNMTVEIKDRWKQPGDEAHTAIPVLYDDFSYDSLVLRPVDSSMGSIIKGVAMYDMSSARVCKTDNVRLRMLSLSYTVPKKFLDKAGINALSFRLQATNLFLIADKRWQGFDPELGQAATTPIPRTYSFGVNITL